MFYLLAIIWKIIIFIKILFAYLVFMKKYLNVGVLLFVLLFSSCSSSDNGSLQDEFDSLIIEGDKKQVDIVDEEVKELENTEEIEESEDVEEVEEELMVEKDKTEDEDLKEEEDEVIMDTIPPVDLIVDEIPLVDDNKIDSTSISIDKNFNLYTSKNLGISIKVPKRVSINNCNEKRWEKVYSDIKVFENETSIFIATEILYNSDTCELITNTLESVVADWNWNWEISPKKIDSFNESLSSIAKKVYKMDECTIKELKDTWLWDLQDVIMNKSREVCPIDYASTFKYSPSRNKYVWWSRGQDSAFWLDDKVLDDEIIESFQFID